MNTDLKRYYQEFKQKSRMLQKTTFESLRHESPEQKQARIKRLLKPENYNDFFMHYFSANNNTGYNLASSDCAPFHINQTIELYNIAVINQFRLMFRGAAKSVHANIGNPLLLMTAEKISFFLLIGINELRAKLLLSDLQLQLESNNRIIDDFGNQRVNGCWTDGEFMTASGVYCMSLGINQPFRGLRSMGNRVHYAVVDDCEDRKRAQNQRLTIEYADKITSDLMGSFDKDNRRLIIANNFIVHNGLIDTLLKRLEKKPATRIHRVDIVDSKGNPTWKRYTKADVARIKNSVDPLSFSREYMNTPVEEGRVFKPRWLQPIQNSKFRTQNYIGYLLHWDLSYKTDGDFKAMAMVKHTGQKIYLIDVFCRQCSLPEAINYHYKTLNKLQLPVISFYDATAAQQSVFENEWHQGAERNNSPYIPLPNLSQHVDKHIRIEATLVSAFFNRRLLIDKAVENCPDWEAAKAQLLAFEKNTKAHDDFPDTLENAVRLADKFFLQASRNTGIDLTGLGKDANPNDRFY